MDTLTHDPVKQPTRPKLLQVMGPGLITGASDDDPSGIATYSQVGAQFGYGLAWTLLFSYPLMAAIQEISARIGCVTGSGIAGNLREHYPRWLSTERGRVTARREHHQPGCGPGRNGRSAQAADLRTRATLRVRFRAAVGGTGSVHPLCTLSVHEKLT